MLLFLFFFLLRFILWSVYALLFVFVIKKLVYVYSFAIYNESGVEFDTESDVISFFFSICLIFISSRDLIPYFFYDDGNINSARASLNILTSMAATTVSIFNWIGWILRMHFFVLFLCFFLFFNIFFHFAMRHTDVALNCFYEIIRKEVYKLISVLWAKFCAACATNIL